MRYLFAIFLLIILGSCSAPSASPEKKPTLVVATDYIAPGDSILFRNFEKKFGAHIVVKKIDTDSLLELYRKDNYNTGIDIVLIHHLYDMRKVVNVGMLESMEKSDIPGRGVISDTKTFVGIGIDPYICAVKKDTNLSVKVYDDLSRIPYLNSLDHKSRAHFYAAFERKMNRTKTFERIEKIERLSSTPDKKSADSSYALLIRQSDFIQRDKKDSVLMGFETIYYPNQSTSGVFHDMLTVGIVDQTSNYELSVAFVNWLTNTTINKKFNRNRDYVSIAEPRAYALYPVNPEKLMQYHTMIDRMLVSMSKTKKNPD